MTNLNRSLPPEGFRFQSSGQPANVPRRSHCVDAFVGKNPRAHTVWKKLTPGWLGGIVALGWGSGNVRAV